MPAPQHGHKVHPRVRPWTQYGSSPHCGTTIHPHQPLCVHGITTRDPILPPTPIFAWRVLSLHCPLPPPQQAAVAEFRSKVLAPFFAELAAQSKFWGKQVAFDMASYIKSTDKLAATQLQYTLENLPPADSVGLFKVAFRTSDAAPSRGANVGSGIVDEAGKKGAAAAKPAPAAAAAAPKASAAEKP